MSWSGVLAIPSRAPGCLRTIILWYRALQGKTIMSARFPATGIIIILEIPSQASGCLHTESVIYVLGNNITSTRFSFTQNQLGLQYVLDNTVTSTRFPAHRINMFVFLAIPSQAPGFPVHRINMSVFLAIPSHAPGFPVHRINMCVFLAIPSHAPSFPVHRINMSVFLAIPSHAPGCLHTESTCLCSRQYHHTHHNACTQNQPVCALGNTITRTRLPAHIINRISNLFPWQYQYDHQVVTSRAQDCLINEYCTMV